MGPISLALETDFMPKEDAKKAARRVEVVECRDGGLDRSLRDAALFPLGRGIVFDCRAVTDLGLDSLRSGLESLMVSHPCALYGLDDDCLDRLAATDPAIFDRHCANLEAAVALIAGNLPPEADAKLAPEPASKATRSARKAAEDDEETWDLQDDDFVIRVDKKPKKRPAVEILDNDSGDWLLPPTLPLPRRGPSDKLPAKSDIGPIALDDDDDLPPPVDTKRMRDRERALKSRADKAPLASMDIARLASFFGKWYTDDIDLGILERLRSASPVALKALAKELAISVAALEFRVRRLAEEGMLVAAESGRIFKAIELRLGSNLPKEIMHALDWRLRDKETFSHWLSGIKNPQKGKKLP